MLLLISDRFMDQLEYWFDCVRRVSGSGIIKSDNHGFSPDNRFLLSKTSHYIPYMYSADIDDCASSPCENNGTCVDLDAAYLCQCVSGFNGTYCENSKLKFLRLYFVAFTFWKLGNYFITFIFRKLGNKSLYVMPCLQWKFQWIPDTGNPVLSNSVFWKSIYQQSTASHWPFADISDIDDCVVDPCSNQGTCLDGVKEYQCNCSPGYTGVDCQTGIIYHNNFTLLFNVSGTEIIIITIRPSLLRFNIFYKYNI